MNEQFPNYFTLQKIRKKEIHFKTKKQNAIRNICPAVKANIPFGLARSFLLGSKQLRLIVIKNKRKISEFRRSFYLNFKICEPKPQIKLTIM